MFDWLDPIISTVGSFFGGGDDEGFDIGKMFGKGFDWLTGDGLNSVTSAGSGALALQGQRETNDLNRRLAEENRAFQSGMANQQMAFQSGSVAQQMAYQTGNKQWDMDFSNQQQAKVFDFNRETAQKMQDFQERMSNSAYQRAIGDMSAAGINPMLAISRGGASSPSGAGFGGSIGPGAQGGAGSTASGSSAQGSLARMENPVAAGVNTAVNARRLLSEIELQDSQSDKLRSEAQLNRASVPKVEQEARTSLSSATHFEAQTWEILQKLRVLLPEQVANLASDTYMKSARSELTVQEMRTEFERTGLTKSQAALAIYAIPKARNEARAEDTFWKEEIAPYLHDAESLSRTIRGGRFFRR